MAYRKYTVTVQSVDGGNRFFIDGIQTPVLNLQEGNVYEFDTAHASNTGHSFKFSTNVDGTHADSGTELTANVSVTGTAGSAGSKTVIRIITGQANLYYFCGNHSGMGGAAITAGLDSNKAPSFVDNYRAEYAELKQNMANEPIKILSPGTNGSRIHQMVLTSDDPNNEITVHFGFKEMICENIAVNLVPGATPASDPFTLTKIVATNWVDDSTIQGLETNVLVTLGSSVLAANRGEYRVTSISNLVLTLANTPGNTITQELGLSITIWRWIPLFSMPVAANSGLSNNPSLSGLNTTYQQWLDNDRYFLINRDLWALNKGNTSSDQGSVYISTHVGDY